MNDATFQKLEFDTIRETLASHCSTRLGAALARSLSPTTKAPQVRQWLEQVRELAGVAETSSLPPLAGVHDIREVVRASGQPAPLEADILADVAETLAATSTLCAWFTRVGEAAPRLTRLGERIGDHGLIAASINDSIDSRGRVRDYASPKLAGIRATVERAKSQIRVVFDRILRHAGAAKMLQYKGATFHNDRGVLPLKAEYRGRIPGIIHRVSDSGATLFVEPAESVELNNTIVQLREQEQREITRILTDLTRLVHKDAVRILETLRAIAVLDLNVAKVRYAKKRNCVYPEINDDGVLDLHEARHPVLIELFDRDAGEDIAPREVVPIDARIGDDFDVLVVTGPNTGGKTVTIKTVGLMALMTQCGIPIPAGLGSKMPVYRGVFVDIGDEQSLQQSLSTFSSHVSNLLDILNHTGPSTLVLIDELGSGTDPDEGAAMGSAIVAEILRLGAKAMVTTHLSALKALAYTTARVDNASVEFDPKTLEPTYHMRMGEPGNSNALIIARRLGMSARLIEHAKTYLDDHHRTLNKAIEGTLASRRQAEEARKSARDEALKSQAQQAAFQRQAEDLKRERETFERWSQWVNNLQPGDDVYIRTMKRPAKVVRMQLHKQTALVSTGRIDIEMPLRDIELPREE